jgi:hypothetical protein
MAITNALSDAIFYLNSKNFFNNIKSVVDMGDQDFKIPLDNYLLNSKIYQIKKDKLILKYLKKKSFNPILSSSFFWKSLGLLKTARMDLIFKDRFLEDNCSELIKFDLNNEYKDQKYMGKFDLVTDFGNNEHPFNIKETFQTMHNLCKNGGYIWSMQSLFNGNGFYNFNSCFYEHIAAFNNYSIVYSYLIFGFENSEKYISTPVDIDYIKYIDLKNANQYTINYIFKKNGEGKFKVPYQGMGYNGDKNMLFNIDYKGKQIPLEQSYIPLSTDSLSIKYLIKEIIKRFPNKIIKTIRRFIP